MEKLKDDFAVPDKCFNLIKSHTLGHVSSGVPSQVVFKKAAWQKVNGYAEIDCKENDDIIGKMRLECIESHFKLRLKEITFINNLCTTGYHLSDYDNNANALSWIESTIKVGISTGCIPVGNIFLHPHLKNDYGALASDFLESL